MNFIIYFNEILNLLLTYYLLLPYLRYSTKVCLFLPKIIFMLILQQYQHQHRRRAIALI